VTSFAERLASGAAIHERIAVVVAHPDDESLWLGTALRRLADAMVIHLTDGAPHDMFDARRLGFVSRSAYADARASEIDAALALLDAAPRRRTYGFVDQTLALHLPELIQRLRRDLAGAEAVITHPYEGGHPDHDAASLAVHAAFPGEIVEFACYPTINGARAFGRFWPDRDTPELVRPLTREEQALVNGAIAAHRTQDGVIGAWRPRVERWRRAPHYDYAAAPPPGVALYDGFGWELTSAKWRALAADALALC
jgi:N-acetylglucosamine malate deacetylase 2